MATIIAVTAMMAATPTPFPDTIKVMMDKKKRGKNGAVSQKVIHLQQCIQ